MKLNNQKQKMKPSRNKEIQDMEKNLKQSKKKEREREKSPTYIYPDYQNQRELRGYNHDKRKKNNMNNILCKRTFRDQDELLAT